MTTSYLATAAPSASPGRNSIGGRPFLPAGTEWPVCPKSGKRMVLFLQFDIAAEYGLAQAPGSHVIVFMSPAINEIHTFTPGVRDGGELAADYWSTREPHYAAYIFGPDVPLVEHADADEYLEPNALAFAPVAPDAIGDPFLFLGGAPRWYQNPEQPSGFTFVGQLSENYPFAKLATAPVQPATFSKKAYGLFLGNSTYFFARPKPERTDELYIVLQN